MKQQASESLNCVDCVDSMLKERVVFTVRTNFNVSYSNVNEDGGVHILTFFLFNNKDNFITIYSICVCVCTHCVLKLLKYGESVLGYMSSDVLLLSFFLNVHTFLVFACSKFLSWEWCVTKVYE